MGWNMQLHMGAKQLVEYADIIRRIRSRIVIDHMGRLDPKLGIKDPAWKFMQEMIARWLPSERARVLALVKNPEEVYGF